MKKRTALTPEQVEQHITAGTEKLLAKKNEAIASAEKKFNKGLKALENKYKEKEEKVKESAVKKVKIDKKELEQLQKDGMTFEDIAKHFEVEIEIIKAKIKSKGLKDKKRKK